ncbi:MAG: serine/threonine protein kinase [Acidobacteria bacterium]|nr:serine/threonine protein kinase [Acidobacteriota bacterium]
MLDSGSILQNRYMIVNKIGQGGMGAVYEAKDQRLGVKVALKETIVSGDSLEKAFEREAKLLAKLRHPVLPVVSDYFFENNGQYLVMQYIEGKDLGQLLSERGAFSLIEVLTWTERLLDALDYLHNQQPPIIHRDIKPNNLKLTNRGEIILLDFGLAKGSATLVQNTNSSSVYGYTPHYAPIEQIEGTGTDARSDIYALAATLYHLLTGVKPIDAMPRVLGLINGQGDPLRPAHEINYKIPLPISQLLTSALSQKRDERPSSATDMKIALQTAIKATNDPNILALLNSTLKLNAPQTSDGWPLATKPVDGSNELSTLIQTEKVLSSNSSNKTEKIEKTDRVDGLSKINSVNGVKEKEPITKPQISTQETQLATQANATVIKAKEKNSRMPFVLAIGSVFVLACVLVTALFFLFNPRKEHTTIVAVDAFNASRDQNKPTLLSAKEILSKGLNEPRYYEFIAEAGEIKLTLNVVSNGSTVNVEVFDKDSKALRYKDNSTTLYTTSSNYANEQVGGIILNPTKQKIILKLSSTYPNEVKACRLRIKGEIELAKATKENSAVLEALSAEFKDRDNPIALATNEILRPGSEKALYYSILADVGEIKLTLDVISNGATVGVNVFDSESKLIRYSNGSTEFSLSSTAYKHEKDSIVIQNQTKQNFLIRIYNVYPNDLKAYRLSLKGPIKFSKDSKKDNSFSSLLSEFKDRDNPTILGSNEIINRGNAKDLYYTFRLEPGNLNLVLDLIANGSTLSVQFFDDKDELMKFDDNSTNFSITSNNHNERTAISLTNEHNQSVLMRISNVYPDSIMAYRIKLDGDLQIIKPDQNANKAFESLTKLFDARDNPTELTLSEITGSGNEKDLYYTFFANEGELKLNVELVASGGTLNIELFDENNNPIICKDKNRIFSITSKIFSITTTDNKTIQQSVVAQINKEQHLIMRISNVYPNSIKDYKLQLSGDLDLPSSEEP